MNGINMAHGNINTFPKVRPYVECADGVILSVQASAFHYCRPRSDYAEKYTHVEVGLPSIKPPESWKEYAEDWTNPTKTVYAYVPVELVWDFIQEHGGFKDIAVQYSICTKITKWIG